MTKRQPTSQSSQDSQTIRRRRAAKTTLIVAAFCLIPLGFLGYVKANYDVGEASLAVEPSPFSMETSEGGYFTNQSLLGKVTLFAFVDTNSNQGGAINADLHTDSDSDVDKNKQADQLEKLSHLGSWAHRQLKKPEHFDESDLDVQTFMSTNSDRNFSAWTLVPFSEHTTADTEDLFESIDLPKQNGIFVFGRRGLVRGFLKLSNYDFETTKRLISRVNFNSAMDEYLSERTFFGPKKDKKDF